MNLFLSDSIFTAEENCNNSFAGYIVVENGIIQTVEKGEAPQHIQKAAEKIIDARGKTITPGFVDAHTHLVHGGSRENELAMKLAGKSYIEIHQSGGGILSTVRATRQASKDELTKKALKSLNTMLRCGTTTVESKSGYGLDMETEIKCLEINRELNKMQPIELVSTYMGAHSTPPEFSADKKGYINFMIKEVMPEVKKRNLAEFSDAFCEDKIFSVEETERIMKAAADLGFKLKLHADEIVPFNGAELAAKMNAVSAEHLMAISDNGIKALAKSGTVAVLLPATSFFLMSPIYAPAKKMIEEGVRVAIATDYNPGSSPTENLQTAMSMACYKMKLSPAQILKGVTLNAAYAICREKTIGSIEEGKQADFVIFDAPNIDYLIYHFGVNSVCQVWKKGKQVICNREI
ncbi:imidazolonepropionase [Treponema pedis]|uniref:imidazolonepropionase n=1 Tax=Treponema pedis TaxID=409322 RepID=UPI00042123DC|nr:imidazolonepropionase [Treponema pedis]QSI04053.1 imidazolonepropionase [Treponema pedis]